MKKVVTIIALLSLAVGAKEPAWYRNGDGGEFYFGRNIPGFVMLNSGNWSWQLRQSGGSLSRSAGNPRTEGEYTTWQGNFHTPGGILRFEERAARSSADSLRVHWSVEAPKPIDTGLLAFQIELPAGLVAGSRLIWDNSSLTLPVDQQEGNASLLAPTPARRLVLPMRDFDLEIAGNFRFSVYDARKHPGAWSNYVVRIHFSPANGKLKSAALALAMKRLPPRPQSPPLEIRPSHEWKALEFPAQVEPGSILDFSRIALDPPAGKYGRVVTRAGKFTFENRQDLRLRVLGVNLCYMANFPDKKQAEKFADELAALGYNAVRFHLMDGTLTKDEKDPQYLTLNRELLDRNDYFWHCLKKRGFYISLDLYCVRRINVDGKPAFHNPAKLEIMMEEHAMRNQEQFTERFLSHINPYTGMARKDDPALMSIALLNENSMSFLLPAHLSKNNPMRRKFDTAADAWNRGRPKAGNPRARYFQYLSDRTWNRLKGFLDRLGCRVPLTSLNCHREIGLSVLRSKFDYVDNHGYQDHQFYPEKKWSYPMGFRDFSAITADSSLLSELAPTRIFGKPFVISEYNFCFPNRFRAEAGPLLGAGAALQDWDGLFRYNYTERYPENAPGRTGVSYDLRNDPMQILSEKIIALLFLRGDVSASQLRLPILVRPDAMERLPDSRFVPASLSGFSLLGQIGSVVSATPPDAVMDSEKPRPVGELLETFRTLPGWGQAAFDAAARKSISSTGEIRHDAGAGTLVIVTPRSEVLTRTTAGTLAGDRLHAAIEGGFGVLCASSMDGKPLADSRRILLLFLTDSLNTGTRFFNATRYRLEAPGRFPALVRRGAVEVTLRLDGESTPELHAVGMDGKRRFSLPVLQNRDGELAFRLDTHAGEKAVAAWELCR